MVFGTTLQHASTFYILTLEISILMVVVVVQFKKIISLATSEGLNISLIPKTRLQKRWYRNLLFYFLIQLIKLCYYISGNTG